MGVPAFFRWLSEKYPQVIMDILEHRSAVVDGHEIPVDLTQENPNGVEFDNLYIDMNGLIHPCSHPEDREAPTTEAEMYVNIMKYVDRIFASIRPRKLVFLAIDGVAPRAKMNQQRSRRFRAARDAHDRQKQMAEARAEMAALGIDMPEKQDALAWDSNVITPGTGFMSRLSAYIWYYVLERMNSNPAWRNIKVFFSDASEPGEGEHKIMSFIRAQRNQPGYNPNQKHVLHGLDADLIMLALATHEPHFTVLREKITFGRKDRDKGASDAQKYIEAQNIAAGVGASRLHPEDEWIYNKPLQGLRISVLREYLYGEFSQLRNAKMTVKFDFERVIDDFVFMCFFVGNDFLPHLPCLDIRDGAVDYLMEVYRLCLPSLGDYLTSPGGNVNLRSVDVILAKVGEIEGEIFRLRKEAEEIAEKKAQENRNYKAAGGRQAYEAKLALERQQQQQRKPELIPLGRPASSTISKGGVAVASTVAVVSNTFEEENRKAALDIRANLLGKRKREVNESNEEQNIEQPSAKVLITTSSETELADGANSASIVESIESSVEMSGVTDTQEISNVTGAEEDEAEDGDANKGESVFDLLKKRIKEKEQAMIETFKTSIKDNVRLHEDGWKERYYQDNFKKEDVERGGGRERMSRTYIEGLCWVLKYYYDGCPSWNWYYPFHYSPFASDLVNIDQYEVVFELSKPFRPLEQLLAVLPAESVNALPSEVQWLMLDDDSPIADLYNQEAPLDPNGHHLPWLWILLLPFIDEARIMDAFETVKPSLTMESRRRNAFGRTMIFVNKGHEIAIKSLENGYIAGREIDKEILTCLDETNDLEMPSTPREFSCEDGQGICGIVANPLPTYFCAIGDAIPAPADPPHTLHSIDYNSTLCLSYLLPEITPHQSILLPGIQLPPATLSDYDLYPRRPPRLNKSRFSMLDILNRMQGNTRRGNFDQRDRDRYMTSGMYRHNTNDEYRDYRAGTGRDRDRDREIGGYNSYGRNGGSGGGYHDGYRGNNQQQSQYYNQQQQQQQQQQYASQPNQRVTQSFSFQSGFRVPSAASLGGPSGSMAPPPPPPMDMMKSQLFAVLERRSNGTTTTTTTNTIGGGGAAGNNIGYGNQQNNTQRFSFQNPQNSNRQGYQQNQQEYGGYNRRR